MYFQTSGAYRGLPLGQKLDSKNDVNSQTRTPKVSTCVREFFLRHRTEKHLIKIY